MLNKGARRAGSERALRRGIDVFPSYGDGSGGGGGRRERWWWRDEAGGLRPGVCGWRRRVRGWFVDAGPRQLMQRNSEDAAFKGTGGLR